MIGFIMDDRVENVIDPQNRSSARQTIGSSQAPMRDVLKTTSFVLTIVFGFTGTSTAKADSATSVSMTPQLVNPLEPHANATISPNGRLLATLHRGSIYVWDLESGAILRTLSPTGAPKFAFTNDNEHLRYVTVTVINGKPTASMGEWNLTTGESVPNVGPAGIFVSAVAPGGKRAILGENPMGTVHVYDLENHRIVRSFGTPPPTGNPANQLDPRTISIMATAANGESVLFQRVNGSVELWDVERAEQRYVEKNAGTTTAVAMSFDGSRAAYIHRANGASKDVLEVIDVASGKPLRSIDADKFGFGALTLSADGKRALTTAPSLTNVSYQVWNLDHGNKLNSGTFDESGMTSTLAFVGNDQFVRGAVQRLEIWNIESARKKQSLVAEKYPVFFITSAAMSPQIDRAVGAGSDGSDLRIFSWDLSNLGLGATYPQTNAGAKIAANASRAWIPNGNGFNVLDLRTSQSRTILKDAGTVLGGQFIVSGDGQKLVIGALRRGSDPMTNKSWPEIALSEWDGQTGAKIDRMVRKRDDLSETVLATSRDGRFVVTSDYDMTHKRLDVQLWDFERDTLMHTFDMHNATHVGATLSENGQTLAVAFMEQGKPGRHTVQIIDVPTGKVRTSMTSSIVGLVQSMAFSPSADKLALGSVTIEVFHTAVGTLAHQFRGDPQWITALGFSADGRFLFTTGRGGTTKLYRLDKPADVTMISSRDEWLVYDEDGYFDASRKGGTLIAAVDGLHAYRIEQLAVRNNRPDLLLEKMGLGNADIIRHFRSRYERRLEKLGISNEAALPTFQSTPEVTITRVQVDGAMAAVNFDAVARGADLLRYNIFVNDVPLFGPIGKTTSGKVQHIEERIELGSGANKIEVSALDARGGESLRAVQVVERKEVVKGNLYYLAFGVSKYQNPKYDLGFPQKDVTDLGDVLRAGAGKTFDLVHVRTYVNEKATVANIRQAKEFLKQATVDDTVVLFIAGHGLHARDAAADYYFATHEIDPKHLTETAARFDIVEDLLMGIRPRKKLFLMDTCESGERDDEDAPSAGIPTTARTLISRSSRQLELDVAYANTAPESPSSKRKYYDRERYIYNDLTRRTGAIVISSSRGSEFSYELPEIANGVFTEEILRALTTDRADRNHDGLVSPDELRTHLSREVPKRTEDQQHPTVDRDNLDARFGFPVVVEAADIADRLTAPVDETSLAEQSVVPVKTPPLALRPHGCGCEIEARSGGATSVFLGAMAVLLARRRRATKRVS